MLLPAAQASLATIPSCTELESLFEKEYLCLMSAFYYKGISHADLEFTATHLVPFTSFAPHAERKHHPQKNKSTISLWNLYQKSGNAHERCCILQLSSFSDVRSNFTSIFLSFSRSPRLTRATNTRGSLSSLEIALPI